MLGGGEREEGKGEVGREGREREKIDKVVVYI